MSGVFFNFPFGAVEVASNEKLRDFSFSIAQLQVRVTDSN